MDDFFDSFVISTKTQLEVDTGVTGSRLKGKSHYRTGTAQIGGQRNRFAWEWTKLCGDERAGKLVVNFM